MNSEKVKEIKKALEICKGLCHEDCPYHSLGCMNDLSEDALTLVYELESENERLTKELDSEWKDRRKAEEDLHKAQWNYKIGLAQSQKRNKELKDRLAELETKIENGSLRFLPCKKGDIVFCIDEYYYTGFTKYEIREANIDSIVILNDEYIHIEDDIMLDLYEWGENAFPTKAEAEKKLEELKNKI